MNLLFVAVSILASIPSTNGNLSLCMSTVTGGLRAIDTDAGATCGLLETGFTSSGTPKTRTVSFNYNTPISGNGDFSFSPNSFTLAAGEVALVTLSGTFDITACGSIVGVNENGVSVQIDNTYLNYSLYNTNNVGNTYYGGTGNNPTFFQ